MSYRDQKTKSDPNNGSGHERPDPQPRVCKGTCGQPIAPKRLAAQPNAQLCVTCLVEAGDVAPIKRFDEPLHDGEVHSTFFTKDRRIERQINHFNKSGVASQADFDIVVGDDSHLGPEPNEIIDAARGLSTIIVNEEDLGSPEEVHVEEAA